MKVFRSFDIPNNYLDAVIAVGNFDGLHLGHQKVILEAKKISEEKKKKAWSSYFRTSSKMLL